MHDLVFDAELLTRYDIAGPRYTSYPTAPQFTQGYTLNTLADCLKQGDATLKPYSIYFHIPYCVSPCFYCGCNRIITRDQTKGDEYVALLKKEMDMVAPFINPQRKVIQLHFGGGTPNFLSPQQLGEIVAYANSIFSFSQAQDRDFSIELDPRTVTVDDIALLKDIGFNRASLGLQDFNPEVQEAINRIQSVDETLAIIEACRKNNFASVNIDLIYGLPKQTVAGFAQTLDTVIGVRPNRLAIYSYAHLPHLFKAQKHIDETTLPTAATKLELLALAISKLTEAGYVYIGMDHFALPDDELAKAQDAKKLHRNFMGYTTHADSDLIGFGVSSISHIGNSFSQNYRDLKDYEETINQGRYSAMRGFILNNDDELRADLIQNLMCHGEINPQALSQKYNIDFDSYFAADVERLAPIMADDLISLNNGVYQASARGRLLLRHMAMCFDAYLHHKKPDQGERPVRFSKAI